MAISTAVRLLLLGLAINFWRTDALTASDECPAGWTFYSNNCYLLGQNANATQAEADCVSKEAHLVSIHSLEEAQFIVQRFSLSLGGNRNWTQMTWIGGQRQNVNQTIKWTDRTPLDYENWTPYNPIGNDSICVMLYSDHYHVPVGNKNTMYKWHDSACRFELKYVCKREPIKPLAAPPLIVAPLDEPAPQIKSDPTAPNPCPDGWSFFSDYCYKFGKDANATQAEANCVKEGAHLASIHSLEEAQFIVQNGNLSLGGNRNWTQMTWIGGQREDINDTVTWTDGTGLDYENWTPYNPIDNNSICVMLYSDHYHVPVGNKNTMYKWHDSACWFDLKYVCKKPLTAAPLSAAPIAGAPVVVPQKTDNFILTASEACPSGWEAFSDSCYLFGNGANWTQAEANCVKDGAHLASIHSKAENDFIVKRATTGKTQSTFFMTWVGGRRSEKDIKKWEWTDGTPFDYTKWWTNQPSALEEKCLQVYSDNYHLTPTAGISDWNDSGCWSPMKYVCKKKAQIQPAADQAAAPLSSAAKIIQMAPSTSQLGETSDLIKYLMRVLCSPCQS